MQLRAKVASLGVSGMVLVALAVSEGWVGVATPPVPGDVPTVGFGFTENVKHGDKMDPVRGIIRLHKEADTHAMGIKNCIKVELHQHEFDAYLQLAYNIGVGAFCGSTLVQLLNQRKYAEACDQILRWDKFKGAPLKGLTLRRQKEHKECLGKS